MVTARIATILVVLSLIAGAVGFASGRCRPFTVVLHTKTMEKGTRQIVAHDERGRPSGVGFEVGNDSGEPSVYSVELPRKTWQSVTIPPLASPGLYEIERITLGNDAVSYHWDQGGACVRETVATGRQTPCDPGSPLLSVGSDSSMVISSIPGDGLYSSLLFRLIVAFAAFSGMFAGGVYLLRPSSGSSRERVAEYAERGLWLAVIILFLFQYSHVWRYAVDLPFWEEWEFFEPAALQRGLTLDWLFAHFGTNQQVVVFTKLMAWLSFRLFSLDFVRLKLMNYLVFGLYLVVLARFARRVSGSGFRLLPLFLIFLVSPLAYEVHMASFQSGEVFVLLFAMGMLCCSLVDRPGYGDGLLFGLCALGAVFSMHTGVAVATILLSCRTVYLAVTLRRSDDGRQGIVASLAISWLLTAAGIIYWLSGFKRSSVETVQRLLPTEGRFWDQFLNLLSYGFGFDTTSVFPGVAILLFLLLPVALLLLNRTSRWEKSTWQILQAILILLALAAMITFGRGGMFTTLKLSRYTVYISPLLLFGGIAWWLLLRGRRELAGVMAGYLLFCFAAFLDNWNYAIYRDLRQMDRMNIECVARYASGAGDGNCPGTHGVPIGGFFDNARKLDINFTRRFPPPLQPK